MLSFYNRSAPDLYVFTLLLLLADGPLHKLKHIFMDTPSGKSIVSLAPWGKQCKPNAE